MATLVETKQEEASDLTNGVSVKKDVVFIGKVVQITNVSPGATLQQMATLFGFVGTVTDIRLYPSDELAQVAVKLCYIKFENSEQCGVAQHLTNTVFIDKALIVVPINKEEVPEEEECSQLLTSINAYAGMATTGFLPQVAPSGNVTSLPGIPPPPVITTSTDPVEIEEIRRTIFVENIQDEIASEQLMAFFSGVGEIKYLRLCKVEEGKYAFIEFSMVESVATAMQYNGVIFGGRCLKVKYAKTAIVRPEREHIATGRTPVRKMREIVRMSPSRRSRTRSPSYRRRSQSRDRSRRSRSHSKSRRRRSGSRSRRRRSHSRSRSPRRRRRSKSRSKSRDRRRRKRSPSKSHSCSPSRRRSRKKSRSASKSPSRKKSRKSNSKSPDRSSKRKSSKKDKDKEKNGTEKDLKSLLTKIYTYEEEKEKEKKSRGKESGDESSKKKKK